MIEKSEASSQVFMIDAGAMAINTTTLNRLEVSQSCNLQIGELVPMVNKKPYKLERVVSSAHIYVTPVL